ncbi:hypothetical protein EJ03DRAFT_269506 [Teratosphaeria nubilosa]|uniref:Large ribosomal subunit protein mL49 n=1 Tax=Teratosphaeria nubilosa TaxID=161662 RepID=A0A6G1LEB0_9PEZI|nr:hypothetical protein EJ03DRAFT_269506 [Teratosphaeria nubilosa]
MPFLRPWAFPKQSTVRHFLRFSTTSRCHQEAAQVRQRLTVEPIDLLPAEECAPNLPYFVSRSRNQELPVYTETKRGGSLKQTRIKNVDGSPQALRDAVSHYLGLGEKEAVVNPVNKHIVLKGSHKPLIERFLRERMF